MLENKTEKNNLNLDQEKDYKTEDIQIFTMKKDLENTGSSVDNRSKNVPEITVSKSYAAPQNNQSMNEKIISEKQKSSPFLAQPQEKAQNQLPQTTPAAVSTPGKKTNWQKLLLVSILIFLILACGTGGYYFWITNNQQQEVAIPEITPSITEETVTFSIEKPNYLPLDIEGSDSAKIKEEIKKYIDKVSASGALTPVEFVVTDLKNNPVGFGKFAAAFGISFSPSLLSSLDTESKFSLFIYNDNDKTRLGLVIDSKDDYNLKNSIFQEEINLPTALAPIFMDVAFNEPQSKTFGSSSYANTEIRYINMISQDELTIDYAIYKNKLAIGTTKMTLYSTMDYIQNHSETADTPEVSEIPVEIPAE